MRPCEPATIGVDAEPVVLPHGEAPLDAAAFGDAALGDAALRGRRVPLKAGWNESALSGTMRAFAAFCTSMVAFAVMPGSST